MTGRLLTFWTTWLSLIQTSWRTSTAKSESLTPRWRREAPGGPTSWLTPGSVEAMWWPCASRRRRTTQLPISVRFGLGRSRWASIPVWVAVRWRASWLAPVPWSRSSPMTIRRNKLPEKCSSRVTSPTWPMGTRRGGQLLCRPRIPWRSSGPAAPPGTRRARFSITVGSKRCLGRRGRCHGHSIGVSHQSRSPTSVT